MSDQTPTIGEPQDEFSLDARADLSLQDLVEQADFDQVHFFIQEGLDDDAIDVEASGADSEFALLPYEHDDNAIDCDTFDLVEAAGFEQATLRDLINFAIERPNIQREYDVIALDTLRTRRIYDDEPERQGETVWTQNDRDKSICQWATGLSNLKKNRTLAPFEIYLDKVIRKDALLLVRKT